MTVLLSVVIDQLNIDRLPIFKPEDNPPVCPDGDGPKPLAIAFELVQAIAGQIRSFRRVG